jgi:hypothetical protein
LTDLWKQSSQRCQKPNLEDTFVSVSMFTNIYVMTLHQSWRILTKIYHGGYFPVSPDKNILMFLWYAANQDSQREIELLFGTGEWAVNTYIKEVEDVICRHSARYIKWPNVQRENDISRSFYDMCRIRNVVGAVNGTHIPTVNCPGGNNDYINRKAIATCSRWHADDQQCLCWLPRKHTWHQGPAKFKVFRRCRTGTQNYTWEIYSWGRCLPFEKVVAHSLSRQRPYNELSEVVQLSPVLWSTMCWKGKCTS